MSSEIKLFSGRANPQLAASIASHLGLPLGKSTVAEFSDSEIQVEIDENVRGRDVFILQSTSAPSDKNLMELLLMADALRRSSAASITAVMPYFGYARQDRRVRSARVPISAKVVADMLAAVGISRVITLELHAEQIQGFFHMPVDNGYTTPQFLKDIRQQEHQQITVVSPDVGGVVRARAVAKKLNDADLAIIDKRRPRPNESQVMNIIGEVENKTCVIVDDIVDTAGTLCEAAQVLKDRGASKVLAYCTHPVLSGAAVARIENSVLDELVVTNTINLTQSAHNCGKIRQLDLAEMLSEMIRRVCHQESLSSMFNS